MSVALRKESVDRNNHMHTHHRGFIWSLSARRAWIEIKTMLSFLDRPASLSARRAWIEIPLYPVDEYPNPSLSARRAWIEIYNLCGSLYAQQVALRKESVDRNLCVVFHAAVASQSLSARRAWIEIAVSLLLFAV